MDSWQKVREQLEIEPIVGGWVNGASPLYAERYLVHGTDRRVSGLDTVVLVTQLGGSRVREGETGNWRTTSLPSESLLIPLNCATHWYYSGTVDFAVFYMAVPGSVNAERLHLLTHSSLAPLQFVDALVGAAALQIVKELQKGKGSDERFMATLADVMLDQTYRILTTPETQSFSPRHAHFTRRQSVLTYINENLAENLSADSLADRAGVSIPHFRRLFREATGVSLHRYIHAVRLERARKLLSATTLPIVQIAQECGFSNQSHLTTSFRTVHATTPAEYRSHIRRKNR